MRVVRLMCTVLAVVAGIAAVATTAIGLAQGDVSGWLFVGPLPFYAVGVAAFWRRPDYLPVRWLVVTGACFVLESCFATLLAWVASIGSVPSGVVLTIGLLRMWAALLSSFAALGFIGTFPVGRPEGRAARVILGIAAVEAALLPPLNALSSPILAPGQFPDASEPTVASGLAIPALAWLGPLTTTLYYLYPVWAAVGIGLLAVRYRRFDAGGKRRTKWLLIGWTASIFTYVPLTLVSSPGQMSGITATVATLSWPLTLVFALGSILLALFQDGVFGIDEPQRRRWVRTIVRLLIALTFAFCAFVLALLAGRVGGTVLAALTAVTAMAVSRPAWQRLERTADRWIFGARLDGYDMLARFGDSLESSPTPAELAEQVARTLYAGLDLTWVTVALHSPIAATAAVGTAQGVPAETVQIGHAGETLGLIKSGSRRDGPLLAEDLRLLGILAAQAGAAASALRLSAELAARVEVIHSQALELAASRDRVVEGQDAERRRIQRDLHDGIQQELVALSAKVSLAQQRLHRGEPAAADAIAELQRDVRTLIADVREFAYAIHPPVLSDRGLVEAVEGQAARLAVPTRVVADVDLRTVRLPERIESTAWYALAEGMSNVVKHSHASSSEVSLHRQDGHLVLCVRDDGRGFDPTGPRGLGLTGLADRLDTVGGTISLHSRPGSGTLLQMEIPLHSEASHGDR
jgi:signal transduction histidine kinase